MAFREQAMMVVQLQLAKRQRVVPMTRDYIIREAARLRARELWPTPAAATRRRMMAPAAGATTSWVNAPDACAPNLLASMSNGTALTAIQPRIGAGC